MPKLANSVDRRRPATLALAVLFILAAGRMSYAGEAPAGDHGPTSSAIFSEARFGVMAHDVGVFGTSKEHGVDLDLDLLFASPDALEFILSPRPELGLTANTEGDTSQIYAGLAWDWTFWDPFFVEGTLGLSLHDGETSSNEPDRKELGCRVLSRESASLGVQFLERHRLMVTLAHISNGTVCSHNEGLDTLGVRYGFRF